MDEQQEALKRIHDKMIFDCLNEALDGKRVLGLKGCPLPVDVISIFNKDKNSQLVNTKKLHIKDVHSGTSNMHSQFWKTQNSRSENNTENSLKISGIKNSISRSQNKHNEANKENFENNSLKSNKLFTQKSRVKDPLIKIFEKTSEQIKKWALFMCGMYEHKPENFKYLPEIVNPLILEKIKESRMTLLEMNEMEELGQKMNDFDDEKYEINLNLNDLLWDHLLNDLCFEFMGIQQKDNLSGSQHKNNFENGISEGKETQLISSNKNEGNKNESDLIPTEEAITKLEYFPNYSCTQTENTTNRINLDSITNINGEDINKCLKSNSEQFDKKGRRE